MAASQRRDLFISVNGSVDNLSNALKAGRSALLDFNSATGSIIEQVERNFKAMGAGSATGAEELARNYTAAAKRIQSAMQEALQSGDAQGALKIFDVNALNQQIAKAEELAATNRRIAESAQIVSQRGGEFAQTQLAIAAAAAQAAVKGEAEVVALRQQASALAEVSEQYTRSTVIQEQAGTRVVRSSGAQRAALQQLSYQVGDISQGFSLGVAPMTIFAQQSGQTIQAIQLLAGESKGFIGFLGGPWGAVLVGAVSILGAFAGKLFESSDSTDKLHGQTLSLVDALSKERFATDAAKKAIDDYNAAKEKARQEDSLSTAQALAEAKARLTAALATRAQIAAQIDKAYADANSAKFVGGGQLLPVAIEGQAALARNQAEIEKDSQTLRNLQADVAKDAVKAVDPIEAINQQYKRMADAALRAAAGNDKLSASLAGTLVNIERQRVAAVKAEQDRVTASRAQPTNEIGRTIDVGEATSIVESIGGRVTSGTRSYEKQAELYARYKAGNGPLAAPPGSSLHESGQAVDVAKSAGVTLAKLKRAFESQGVRITELLDEGDHFHVGFGKKGKSPEDQAKAADDAAQKERERVAAFDAQLTQAQGDYLQAQTALNDSADEQLSVALARIDTERATRDAAADRAVVEKKYTAAEAAQLKAVNDKTAVAKADLATNRAAAKAANDNLEVARTELRDRISVLDLQGNIADTLKDRRRIALQILALEEQERLLVANRLIASHDPTGKDQAEGARIKAQVEAEHGGKVEVINRQTEGPLAQWKRDAADTKTILESIEVKALDEMNDGLTDAITNALHLHGIFGDIIGDLIKLALKKAEIAAIDAIFPTGGESGGGGIGAFFGSIFGHKDGVIPGYADGIIRGPGTGTSDSILAWVSNGEGIMNERAVRNFGPILKAMNDNSLPGFAGGNVPSWPSLPSGANLGGGGQVIQHISYDLRGAMVDRDVMAETRAYTDQRAAEAVSVSVNHTNDTLRQLSRSRL